MRSQASIAAAAISPTRASSVTEPAKPIASPPASVTSRATFAAASAFMSLTTTLAPSRESSSACDRPNPPPAPVTIATRPASLISTPSDASSIPFTH